MTTTTLTSLIEHPWVVDPAEATDRHTISFNPSTGEPIAAVRKQTTEEYNDQVDRCQAIFKEWRMLPAPKRGEIVRRAMLGDRSSIKNFRYFVWSKSAKNAKMDHIFIENIFLLKITW